MRIPVSELRMVRDSEQGQVLGVGVSVVASISLPGTLALWSSDGNSLSGACGTVGGRWGKANAPGYPKAQGLTLSAGFDPIRWLAPYCGLRHRDGKMTFFQSCRRLR